MRIDAHLLNSLNSHRSYLVEICPGLSKTTVGRSGCVFSEILKKWVDAGHLVRTLSLQLYN